MSIKKKLWDFYLLKPTVVVYKITVKQILEMWQKQIANARQRFPLQLVI